MKYTVEVLPGVVKSLSKIDKRHLPKIRAKLQLLVSEPRHSGCLKLKGEENVYRTRVGNYRIIYKIFDNKVHVIVIDIDHRKDVYK